MKKLLIFIISLAFIFCLLKVSRAGDIYTVTVVDGDPLGASGTSTYYIDELNTWKPNGHFGLQVLTGGTGSGVKIEYLLSNDCTTYSEPSGASDITSGQDPGSAFYTFTPGFAKCMAIRVTEVSGNEVSGIEMTLSIE